MVHWLGFVDVQHHSGPLFDLAVVTLTYKLVSGLYLETVRCGKLILGRNIGWGF